MSFQWTHVFPVYFFDEHMPSHEGKRHFDFGIFSEHPMHGRLQIKRSNWFFLKLMGRLYGCCCLKITMHWIRDTSNKYWVINLIWAHISLHCKIAEKMDIGWKSVGTKDTNEGTKNCLNWHHSINAIWAFDLSSYSTTQIKVPQDKISNSFQ